MYKPPRIPYLSTLTATNQRSGLLHLKNNRRKLSKHPWETKKLALATITATIGPIKQLNAICGKCPASAHAIFELSVLD